jgi:hypothetical protein
VSTIHIVQPGEHLSAIAIRHGFDDYRSLWYHGENAELRQQRKNPNVLLAGDRVAIPDRTPREEFRPTDKRHRFVKEGQPLRLRVRLLDEGRRVVSALTAKLAVDGTEHPPRPLGGDGQVDEAIPKPAATGRLTVNPRATDKRNVTAVRSAGRPPSPAGSESTTPASPGSSAAAPGPQAAAASTPASIEPREPGCENELGDAVPVVEDPPQAANAPPAESNAPSLPATPDPLLLPRPELAALVHTTARWIEVDVALGIGELDPVDTVSGQIQRLHNLGYEPGLPLPPASEADKRRQGSAIEEFQCDHGLAVDGVCGPATQGKLLQIHGC